MLCLQSCITILNIDKKTLWSPKYTVCDHILDAFRAEMASVEIIKHCVI